MLSITYIYIFIVILYSIKRFWYIFSFRSKLQVVVYVIVGPVVLLSNLVMLSVILIYPVVYSSTSILIVLIF